MKKSITILTYENRPQLVMVNIDLAILFYILKSMVSGWDVHEHMITIMSIYYTKKYSIIILNDNHFEKNSPQFWVLVGLVGL